MLDDQIVLKITPEKEVSITKFTADKIGILVDFVKGTVTDNQKRPLSGVTVKIKKNNQVAITDANGNFTIQANKGDVLVFSSLGFGTKEVQITEDVIQVQLEEKVSPLDEVVVGSNLVATTRRAETASTTLLNAKDLERIPGNNLNDIFTGYIPGAFISNLGQDGSAGSKNNTPFGPNGGTLTLRGANGFAGGSPIKLYIDGIESSEGSNYLGLIDKNSIEKIEIVRGSSAATLYGSGANGGVILITTKKASRRQTVVNLSSAAGFVDSKWVSKKAFQQEQTFSISQGLTDNVNYLIGGDLHGVGEYLPNAKQRDAGVYTNLNVKLSDKLNVAVNGRYSSNYSHSYRSPIFDEIATPAIKDYFYYDFVDLYTASRSKLFNGGLTVNYNPTSWWKHNFTAGFSKINSEGGLDGSANITTAYLANPDHGFSLTNYESNRPTYRYNNTITLGNKDKLQLVLLSGIEYSSFDFNSSSTSIQPKIPAGSGYRVSASYTDGNKIINRGFFAQAAASYLDKYFLTFAYRFEKSNTFDVNVSNPKVGLTTNFNVANFIFKPRIQYGLGITLPPYEALHPDPNQTPGVTALPNPDIKPQEQRGFDYGLEIYSKDGNFRFEAVYYRYDLKNSFAKNFAGPRGNSTFQWLNTPPARNQGLELSATYQSKNGLRLTSTFSQIDSYSTTDNPIQFYTFTKLNKGDRLPFIIKYTFAQSIGYDFKRVFGNADKLGITISAVGSAKGILPNRFAYDVAVAEWFATFTGPYPTEEVMNYPTITRMNFSLEYQVLPTLSVYASGKNILNNNNSELGKIYPAQGASWLFGLKYRFSK